MIPLFLLAGTFFKEPNHFCTKSNNRRYNPNCFHTVILFICNYNQSFKSESNHKVFAYIS